MKHKSNEILCKVLKTLDEAGYSISEVDSEDYCLEIVAKKGNIKLLIKSLTNIDSERRDSAEDLASLAVSFNATPLIIGHRMQKGVIEPGTMYERFGVNVINPETFRNAALEKSLPIVYSKRGGLYVKIDGKALKRLREKEGMSLGDLANKIGVSRKAVYEYERSQMGATLATVARIEEILDADIITGINVFDWRPSSDIPEKSPTGVVARQLHGKLKKIGCKSIGFNFAPIDVHARNIGASFLTSEENVDEERLERKVSAAIEVGKIMGMQPILVTGETKPRDQGLTLVRIDEIKKLEKTKDLMALLGLDCCPNGEN
uniref:Putative HTH-type transcriptional regulatory protein ENS19_07240 n=1 Tax=Candidatus Methanomethylicus mesodigestus TaxID=1867258 RepID=A0A7C3F2N8_9CREN